jgi:hypothetical protein
VVSHGIEVTDDQKMFDYIESGGNMFGCTYYPEAFSFFSSCASLCIGYLCESIYIRRLVLEVIVSPMLPNHKMLHDVEVEYFLFAQGYFYAD